MNRRILLSVCAAVVLLWAGYAVFRFYAPPARSGAASAVADGRERIESQGTNESAGSSDASDPRLLKNLAQQFAVYATGRPLAFSDRDEIAGIIQRTQKQGGGIRTLLHELVQIRLFQTK